MSPEPPIEQVPRSQVLAAATSVIVEQGIAATGIADVAERAGTGTAAILFWFRTTDELLAEALRANEERSDDELNARLAGLVDPAAKLTIVIKSSIEETNWRLWIDLWARALHDEKMRTARDQLEERWRALLARIIRSGVDKGVFAPVNPDEAALALSCLIDGLAISMTVGDSRLTKGHVLQICIDAAGRLLGAELRFPQPEVSWKSMTPKTSSASSVITAETSNDPPQPSRFEKRTNMASPHTRAARRQSARRRQLS